MKNLYLSLVLTICIMFSMISCTGMEIEAQKSLFGIGVKITTSQILKNKDGLAEKLYPVLLDIEQVIEKGEIISIEELDKYVKNILNDANLTYEEQLLINEFFGSVKDGILAYIAQNMPNIDSTEKLVYAKEVIGWIKETTKFYIDLNR